MIYENFPFLQIPGVLNQEEKKRCRIIKDCDEKYGKIRKHWDSSLKKIEHDRKVLEDELKRREETERQNAIHLKTKCLKELLKQIKSRGDSVLIRQLLLS